MRLRIIDRFVCDAFRSCPGTAFVPDYKATSLGNGNFTLVKVGSTDLHAKILAEVPATDIHVIITRLNAGDNSVLRQDTPMYGDFTTLPKSTAEALQMVLDGQRAFDSLPLTVRDHFGHDFRKWFASAGSSDWMEVMKDFSVSAPAVHASVPDSGQPVVSVSVPSPVKEVSSN